MAVVAKWLTHQIVALALEGSIPSNRPIIFIEGFIKLVDYWAIAKR
jgi:hypothetical protein